jgi:ketoreductase RED2
MSRIVLVTGSTSGIGLAVAQAFSQLGDTLILNSANSEERGRQIASEMPKATYVKANIGDVSDVEVLTDYVREKFGRLDILINNAGRTKVIPHADLEQASVAVFKEIFETNVFGTWDLTTKLMPLLQDSNGSVVMTTSYAGIRPAGSSIPYAASKAALNHIVALLARVVGPNVRVNAVAPGLIDTPWTKEWQKLHERVSNSAPLKRSGLATDVADAIVAISLSPYVTGQVLTVDGGLSLL